MATSYFDAWLLAFLFTQLVEIPIYYAGLLYRKPLSIAVSVAAGASAITHPLLWFVFFPNVRLPYWWTVLVGELLVWVVEGAYFRFLFGLRRAWLWAFVANAASLGAGFLSRRLWGVP